MLARQSCCTEPCCDLCIAKAPKEEEKTPGRGTRVNRSPYIAPWMKTILAVMAIALFFTGLYTLIAAQAIWNADIEAFDVSVYGADGTAHTLPGLSFNGALFVSAQAYEDTFSAQDAEMQRVSPVYWGDRMYFPLTEKGELKEN